MPPASFWRWLPLVLAVLVALRPAAIPSDVQSLIDLVPLSAGLSSFLRSKPSMVAVGDKLPEGTFMYVPIADAGEDATVCVRPSPVKSDQIWKAGKKVVLVGIPGAFTPTCSEQHLPGFKDKVAELKSRGVDSVYVIAANDAFVLSAFGRLYGLNAAGIQTLSDPDVAWLKAADLVFDGSAHRMGLRAVRFAIIVDDGKVAYIGTEAPGDVKTSSVDAVLAHL